MFYSFQWDILTIQTISFSFLIRKTVKNILIYVISKVFLKDLTQFAIVLITIISCFTKIFFTLIQ